MMKSSWGLNELAVKHNGTGPSLWMERKKERWVETDIFSLIYCGKNKKKFDLNKVPSTSQKNFVT